MTQDIVNCFTGHGVRVMLSIGGITYVSDWDTALSQNPMLLGQKDSTSSWLRSAAPAGAGRTPGLLGYMFWAADTPSSRGVTTDPPNTCAGGVDAGATALNAPIPTPALRQN
ncbi:MAG: hypothetical protein ACRDVE_20055 [Actinocrinis sp.]